MPAEEDGDGQPSFSDLLEELGVVVTIPTFLIIVLQVTGSVCRRSFLFSEAHRELAHEWDQGALHISFRTLSLSMRISCCAGHHRLSSLVRASVCS